jgi:pimeloyl-ACP methyl ester carboxylesterase
VDAFTDFFGSVGITRPHVAGNSMGGAIALELARRGVVSSVTAGAASTASASPSPSTSPSA